MRLCIIFLVSILLVGCGEGDGGGNADSNPVNESEPNNIVSHANLIEVPALVSGKVSSGNPEDLTDLFTFEAVADKDYRIELSGMGNTNLDLWVLAVDYTQYFSLVDAPLEGSTETVEFRAQQGIRYIIYVDIDPDVTATSTYQLRITSN